MCWVNVVSTRRADDRFKLNLSVAQAINETPSEYEVFYAGDVSPYKVEKTPEMVEAYNSLVPVKAQPVVPAESEEEWVTQDRVPYRHGVDQRRWVIVSTGETHCGYEWGPADREDFPARHGHFLDSRNSIQVHLRCRPDQRPEVQP